METFVRKLQIGYIISIFKLIGTLGLIAVILILTGIATADLTALALASLIVHSKEILTKIYDIFAARKLVKSLNLIFVDSEDDLKETINKIKENSDD